MSAELMKSKFVRRPSVRHPSSVCGIDYLWSYCMDFFQILVVASPGPYAQTLFSFLKKKHFLILYEYFSFLLTWDPMGVKISKRYSSYKSQPKVLKLVLNFPPNGPNKILLGIFDILSFWFLMIFFQKFQTHHYSLWRNQKPQLSGKRAIVEQNGVKFGTRR